MTGNDTNHEKTELNENDPSSFLTCNLHNVTCTVRKSKMHRLKRLVLLPFRLFWILFLFLLASLKVIFVSIPVFLFYKITGLFRRRNRKTPRTSKGRPGRKVIEPAFDPDIDVWIELIGQAGNLPVSDFLEKIKPEWDRILSLDIDLPRDQLVRVLLNVLVQDIIIINDIGDHENPASLKKFLEKSTSNWAITSKEDLLFLNEQVLTAIELIKERESTESAAPNDGVSS
ncbi:MAG: hypothetical protein ACFFD4_02570 [Candidatus Odinarchaeota archaeon]